MDYTGSLVEPALTVTDLGNELIKGTDYDVSYSNNRNAGTAKAKITGKGNYCGSDTASFRIVKRVTGITLDRTDAVLNVGETLILTATVLPYDASDRSFNWSSTDGTVASVSNGTVTAKKKGTARIDATTADGAKVSSCSITVKKKNLSDNCVRVTGIENKKYTGSPQTQENVVIYYGNTALSRGTDYTVDYSDNTDYGTAVMTVTGTGAYEGNRRITFSITGADDVDFTITSVPPISYGQRLDEIDLGYRAVFGGHTVSGSAVFADPSIKPSVSDSSTTEYEVIFTPNEIQRYACAAKKTRVTVNPAGLKNITVTGTSELVYGDRLAECEITGTAQSAVDLSDVPGSFEFAYSGIKPAVSDSDKTEYDLYFFPDDSTDFYAGSTKTTVTVKKAIPRISYEDQSVLDSLTLQKGHSLSEITSSLPAGFEWHSDVDISAIYDTADEIIYAHVLYNPDPDNYNDTTGTATIRVTDQAAPQREVSITVKNGFAKYKGKIVNSALPGTKVDLIAKVPDGMLFKTWIVTNAIVDPDKEQTTMTVGNADVTAEAVLEKDPEDTDEEPPEKEEFDGKIKSLSIINEDGKKVKTLKLAKGETAYLYADVVMSKGDEPDTHFRSDNTKVVRITDGGKVTGCGQGSATVTVYCGNKTAKCTVTVAEDIENVKVKVQKDKLLVGEKMVIRADTEPYTSASDRTVSWSVDNKKLAAAAGGAYGCVLTAKKAGTVTVTAKIKTKDARGSFKTVTDSCTVRIEDPYLEPVASGDKSYRLGFKKQNVKINVIGSTGTVTAVLSDSSKAGIVSIDWISSNEDVIKIINADSSASVSGKKAIANATVSACGIGYAFVTARVTDNETGLVNVKRCKVTVNAPVKSIRISKDSLGLLDGELIEMRKGQRDALFLDMYPDSPTNINRVTWTAKGGGVTVKNGVIYANRVVNGVSKVIVTCGNAKHTIFVNVTK